MSILILLFLISLNQCGSDLAAEVSHPIASVGEEAELSVPIEEEEGGSEHTQSNKGECYLH